jgi:DNA repair exonuclease SbcCD ATPase subunit
VIKVAAGSVAASKVFVNAELNELSEGGVEDVDEKEMKALQEKLEEVQANLKGKTEEIAELQKANEEFKAKDYEGQIAKLNTTIEGLTANVTEASEKVVLIEAEKVELQKQLDEQTVRADKSEAELDEIRKTETARDRMAKLSEIKTVEDADATLAELRDMSNDTFEAVLKYAGETKAEESTDDKTEDAEAALDDVEENEDAELNASTNAAEMEKDGWESVAAGLCGREKNEEGGE